jgi:hypothetical protein
MYTIPDIDTEDPDYQRRQNFASEDEVPLVIDGHEVGCICVADLLP